MIHLNKSILKSRIEFGKKALMVRNNLEIKMYVMLELIFSEHLALPLYKTLFNLPVLWLVELIFPILNYE